MHEEAPALVDAALELQDGILHSILGPVHEALELRLLQQEDELKRIRTKYVRRLNRTLADQERLLESVIASISQRLAARLDDQQALLTPVAARSGLTTPELLPLAGGEGGGRPGFLGMDRSVRASPPLPAGDVPFGPITATGPGLGLEEEGPESEGPLGMLGPIGRPVIDGLGILPPGGQPQPVGLGGEPIPPRPEPEPIGPPRPVPDGGQRPVQVVCPAPVVQCPPQAGGLFPWPVALPAGGLILPIPAPVPIPGGGQIILPVPVPLPALPPGQREPVPVFIPVPLPQLLQTILGQLPPSVQVGLTPLIQQLGSVLTGSDVFVQVSVPPPGTAPAPTAPLSPAAGEPVGGEGPAPRGGPVCPTCGDGIPKEALDRAQVVYTVPWGCHSEAGVYYASDCGRHQSAEQAPADLSLQAVRALALDPSFDDAPAGGW